MLTHPYIYFTLIGISLIGIGCAMNLVNHSGFDSDDPEMDQKRTQTDRNLYINSLAALAGVGILILTAAGYVVWG